MSPGAQRDLYHSQCLHRGPTQRWVTSPVLLPLLETRALAGRLRLPRQPCPGALRRWLRRNLASFRALRAPTIARPLAILSFPGRGPVQGCHVKHGGRPCNRRRHAAAPMTPRADGRSEPGNRQRSLLSKLRASPAPSSLHLSLSLPESHSPDTIPSQALLPPSCSRPHVSLPMAPRRKPHPRPPPYDSEALPPVFPTEPRHYRRPGAVRGGERCAASATRAGGPARPRWLLKCKVTAVRFQPRARNESAASGDHMEAESCAPHRPSA
mmetsp:Transcript_54972/g.159131  ORF Transcript_54972/g.159131 Transcript_54972/m.159131 type:complete len:268 (-) Transcript_54972:42-845(-)